MYYENNRILPSWYNNFRDFRHSVFGVCGSEIAFFSFYYGEKLWLPNDCGSYLYGMVFAGVL